MKHAKKIRRAVAVFGIVISLAVALMPHHDFQQSMTQVPVASRTQGDAVKVLDELEVKGRAPKTNYTRTQFGSGWTTTKGCDTRNMILSRDLENVIVNDGCKVTSGILQDPYTGKMIEFQRGTSTSDDVQIDHVVALSDAWQKGAQQFSPALREQFANDQLELLAVEGAANQQKSDGDAATWLPPYKDFRCQYVARQIAVKKKYSLWITIAEKEVMHQVLSTCPEQALPVG